MGVTVFCGIGVLVLVISGVGLDNLVGLGVWVGLEIFLDGFLTLVFFKVFEFVFFSCGVAEASDFEEIFSCGIDF